MDQGKDACEAMVGGMRAWKRAEIWVIQGRIFLNRKEQGDFIA